VGDLMRAPVPPVRETATLPELADRFLTSSNNFLPVVDAKNRLIGLVALQDLKEYLNAGEEMIPVIAYDVMRPPPMCVTPNQLLLDTLPVMLSSEQRNVPVVNSRTDNQLVGAVVRAEVLGLLSEAIAARGDQTTPAELSRGQQKNEGNGAAQGGQQPNTKDGG
jgi:CIC family chloride channel protein